MYATPSKKKTPRRRIGGTFGSTRRVRPAENTGVSKIWRWFGRHDRVMPESSHREPEFSDILPTDTPTKSPEGSRSGTRYQIHDSIFYTLFDYAKIKPKYKPPTQLKKGLHIYIINFDSHITNMRKRLVYMGIVTGTNPLTLTFSGEFIQFLNKSNVFPQLTITAEDIRPEVQYTKDGSKYMITCNVRLQNLSFTVCAVSKIYLAGGSRTRSRHRRSKKMR
jgi:hypothetical protein